MNARVPVAQVELPTVAFTLDHQPLYAFEGETILKAAERHGVLIPRLCHQDGLRPDGNCRACVVEIAGERTLAPSCCRSVTSGMAVQAKSERALKSQKLVLELLLSDMPEQGYKWNDAGAGAGTGSPHPNPLPEGEGIIAEEGITAAKGITATGPALLPLPLGEGRGEGSAIADFNAGSPHPNPLPKGEGTRQRQRQTYFYLGANHEQHRPTSIDPQQRWPG